MSENFPLFVIVGLIFGGLAATCADLIAYHEYRRQFLPPTAAQRARRSALVTFAFFFLAACALPWVRQGLTANGRRKP